MTVKWGIIGCGDVVEHKVGPAFNQVKDSELIAVIDINAEKAKDFAQRRGVPKYYSDVDALLGDDEINAVYIATPNYLHAQSTIKAAEHGKHILCEKPMALTVKECEKMINACEENKVKLMIAYYQRFQPAHQKPRELIRQGVIGKIIMCKAQTGGWGQPEGWLRRNELSGGGVLANVGCHIIDLLRYLLGEIVELSAYTDALVFEYPVEDIASLTVRFEDGVHGLLNFCCDLAWAIPFDPSNVGNTIEICGTKGRISWPIFVEGDLIVKVYVNNELQKYKYTTDKVLQRVPMIKHFAECVKMNKEPSIPGIEGLKDLQVVLAAYESSKTKKVVKVKDVV